MDQIDKAVEGLVEAIHSSKEYKRYQDICAKVREYPDLEQQIHEFRKKNFEVQNTSEGWDLYERVDQLELEGMEIRKKPFVGEYLAAELAFCRLFQRINWTLVQNLDFDLNFSIDN